MGKFSSILFLIAFHCALLNLNFAQQSTKIPDAPREFRGVWVATVSNIDWPSRKGLTAEQQKSELINLFDEFEAARMNAVIFQIRPTGDALYDSPYEPWAPFLTGTMGQDPGYDPLTFAIEEAHKRGLELHAWINPFRLATGTKPKHPDHAVNDLPEIAKQYSKYYWLDPTDQRSHDYVINIISDILDRYDVDAIHFDDYFYPYPDRSIAEFPDTTNWEKFRQNGGKLSRSDWRRSRVNEFIQRVSQTIKAKKPTVRFGISPFGIWRPGYPANVKGMDAYEDLFADSKLWLQEGWVDYFAPQLYWSIDSSGQSFPSLMNWWEEQNTMKRNLWPGIGLYRINSSGSSSYKSDEIINQVRLTQKSNGTTGTIHFSAKQFSRNLDGVYDKLRKGPYQLPALVPASPWLDSTPPNAPLANFVEREGRHYLTWQTRGEKANLFVVYAFNKGKWWLDIVPGDQSQLPIKNFESLEVLAISAVDEVGNESAKAIIRLK